MAMAMAMASKLALPIRRFLHSSSCTRVLSSSARPSPLASEFPPTNPNGLAVQGQLVDFLESVTGQPHNFEAPDRSPTVVPFRESCLIRPVDFRRDMLNRPTNRKRASIGPGREARYNDIFLQLGIDPRREADNVTLMSGFVTRLGRIQPRSITGLSQRSQRLLGKAIKRAKMMGVLPIFSNPRAYDLTYIPSPQARFNNGKPNSERRDRRP